MSDDIIIHDSENFQSKSLGIKEIALEQYRRCAIEGSRNILNNPVQREVYINAVRSMEIIAFPDILKSEKITKKITVNEQKIDDLEKEYQDHHKQLKTQANDGDRINIELLRDTYERRLIKLFQEKLIILGLLLKDLSYYGESDITDE